MTGRYAKRCKMSPFTSAESTVRVRGTRGSPAIIGWQTGTAGLLSANTLAVEALELHFPTDDEFLVSTIPPVKEQMAVYS